MLYSQPLIKSSGLFCLLLASCIFSLATCDSWVSRASADQQPIIIDGQFEDWANSSVTHQDPLGDTSALVDFGKLWLADDDEFLFIRIELTFELSATTNNSIRLFLDTDADSSTGFSIAGIGAELEWNLGSRFGLVFISGNIESISASDIQFRGGPTVTANEFEFAISKNSIPDGINPLFNGSVIRLAMDNAGGADQIPDQGQVLSYQLDVGSLPNEVVIPLERQSVSDLRMMTHNVLFDSPWNPNDRPRFERLWSAVAPDILNLQEINNHSLSETIQLVDDLVPLPSGESWQGAKNSDCATVTRFPVVDSWGLSGNLATLIDATSALGSELLVVNAHLPCCDNDSPRQQEVDEIMEFIRDAQSPGGILTLSPDTPIVICGDLNLVGFSQQLNTLLTGDIDNNSQFGPDFQPDWDGTGLANLISRQTERRMGYTWRNDNSSFWPGQLDYVIYSDSVLELGNHYLLYTPEMSDPQSLGFQANDSLASDHLVFVSDFKAANQVLHGDVNLDGLINLLDVDPFVELLSNGSFQAEADINKDGAVNLLDVDGFVLLLAG